ncbi:hypothetical protein AMTR_s00070p00121110 [Amborella trichopoda]|uniref:Uncharacterized protein n=1 Tax=Amborella trichopoda TaxID=13333 RepID=U5DEI2_AMBTC|nr:hypothetical protein AMTR_s00070p00121110 [Amborella trichopoda]
MSVLGITSNQRVVSQENKSLAMNNLPGERAPSKLQLKSQHAMLAMKNLRSKRAPSKLQLKANKQCLQ